MTPSPRPPGTVPNGVVARLPNPVLTGGPLLGRTLLTAIAPVTWGTTYLVTSELLPPGRPLFSAVARALPVGLLVLAATRTLPRGQWWWRAAVLGTLNIGAFFALLFVAAYRLPGGVAATLGALQPLMVAGLALLALRERTTRWRLSWGMVGVIGVALMVLRGRLHLDPLGLLAGTAGTAVMATGIVLTKRWGRPVRPITFAGWQLIAGGLVLAPVALVVEGAPPAITWTALAGYTWLAVVGTLLAYTLWFDGLGRLPVASASFLPLLAPVVATALGWLVLGQTLTSAQSLGFALALLAIGAAQLAWPPASAARREVHDPSFDRTLVAEREGHGPTPEHLPDLRTHVVGPGRPLLRRLRCAAVLRRDGRLTVSATAGPRAPCPRLPRAGRRGGRWRRHVADRARLRRHRRHAR